jgi:serpin B
MILANAIYFKGDWARQFDETATRDEPFYLAANSPVDVPMMRQEAPFKYLQGDDVEFLEMRYEGDDLSMLILLPKQGELSRLEESLTPTWVNGWIVQMMESDVVVVIPRFKMTRRFVLAPVLSSMGMSDAFVESRADFSGMNGQKPALFISDVVHKAFVEVNEEGTEAAAATGVGMRITSIAPTPQFIANRPFLFLIRENETGSILFMGRVADPTATGEASDDS